MSKSFALLRIVLVVLAIAALTGAALPAFAQDPAADPVAVNNPLDPSAIQAEPPPALPAPVSHGGSPVVINAPPSDDRDNSTPTAWYIWAHQTAAQVTDTINQGYRLVDIYVEAYSPSHLFTGVYVANDDSYQKAWWWYYGIDGATLSSHLATNNARLISLKAYDVGSGQIRFTAVMISNTGADATAWWWYYNATTADIISLVTTNQARLTQLHAYETNGQVRYAVVMVDNTGAANKAWWWYFNISPATVATYINANSARLVDMDRNPLTGNLNVVMTSCATGCPYWWWYVGVPQDQLMHVIGQVGARVIDVNDYPGCGSTCYDVLLINNSNAITTRVGEMLRSGTDGTKGLYLEEVGGPVLANLMNDYVFEPASTLKVAVHLHTMQQIQNNPAVSPSTLINQYQPPATGSCPGNTVIGQETIFDADQAMMWRSDNTTTRELVDYFGETVINNTMSAIGMTDSSINHVFGCGGPVPNETTLDDLATLYKGVANGALLDPLIVNLFYSQMAGTSQFASEGYDWTHLVDTDVPLIIDQEAPAGMSTALKDNFEEGINLDYKAGGYEICTSSDCANHLSIFGRALIPFCDAGGDREYVFGLFIDDASSHDDADDTFTATKAELLREQIRDGLASCFNRVYLPIILR